MKDLLQAVLILGSLAVILFVPPMLWDWLVHRTVSRNGVLFQRLVITKEQGDVMPPWWYAYGYQDWNANRLYYYPLPVALLVRAALWVHWRWNWLRSRPTAWDRKLHKIEVEAYSRGYSDAVRDSLVKVVNQMAEDLRKEKAE